MKYEDLKREFFLPQRSFAAQDYFAIPVDKLEELGFTTDKKILDLTQRELKIDLLEDEGFSLEEKETVVLNLPTGTGKSELFYDLIQQYNQDGGYLILVCSPFVKLVEKDTDALRKRGVDVFSYKDLIPKEGGFESMWRALIRRSEAPVHVMTIHCLLRNSGSTFFEQAMQKDRYMEELIEVAEKNGKKVLLFIDELHESVENFSRRFLPHLVRWRKVLSKVFVASASHTPSSFAVIQHLGRLTNNRISVFESKRSAPQANAGKLFIHLAHKRYDEKDLSGLIMLRKILSASDGNRVHILCAYKSVAEALLSRSDRNPIKEYAGKFKKLVSGDEDPFDPMQNSIGTTFKTGVNMEDENTVFIIILPFSVSNGYGGIFSDGIPSIIQTFGRLRKGGTYHVVMGVPSQLISGTVLKKANGGSFSADSEEVHKTQNELLDAAIQYYDNRVSSIMEEINFLRNCKGRKLRVASFYPSLQDFLLEEAKEKVILRSLSGGKSPDAYLLWAACNDQLTAAKLQHVTLYYLQKQELVLTEKDEDNARQIFALFSSLEKEVAESSLQDAFSLVHHQLFKAPEPYKLTFKLKKKKVPNLGKNKAVLRALLSTVTSLKLKRHLPALKPSSGRMNVAFEREYLTMLLNAPDGTLSADIGGVVKELHQWRSHFFSFIEEHSVPATHKNAHKRIPANIHTEMDPEQIRGFKDLIIDLNKYDSVFQSGMLTDNLTKTDRLNSNKHLFEVASALFTRMGRSRVKGKNVAVLKPGWQDV